MTARALGAVTVVALSFWGGIGHAQSATLAFEGQEGQVVYRLFQVHTVISEVNADGEVHRRQAARLGRVREQVLSGVDGGWVVHLAVDSLVLRVRDADAPWRESIPTAPHAWAQLQVDRRLGVEWRGSGNGESTLFLHLLSGFPGLLLPESPTWPGRSWRQELEVSPAEVTMGLMPGDGGIRLPLVMVHTVDSIALRAQDTLAFVSLDGRVVRSRVRETDGGTVEYGGRVTGALVWSSGWGRFVSAATRTIMSIGVRNGGPQPTVTVQTTTRQAVRPAP